MNVRGETDKKLLVATLNRNEDAKQKAETQTLIEISAAVNTLFRHSCIKKFYEFGVVADTSYDTFQKLKLVDGVPMRVVQWPFSGGSCVLFHHLGMRLGAGESLIPLHEIGAAMVGGLQQSLASSSLTSSSASAGGDESDEMRKKREERERRDRDYLARPLSP